ncbi:hypothetical protein LWC35_12595 [Pseudonocardia kujensis]|uniref:hypothetical protein n=1 Tax=Pseudonocardia kujensis TaxID=1128675 RepID=UPI001E5B39F7|nr:hypothetical protein [Pseudonocardia kujensis]MCE0763739.1 hypothetical protein [Pseudonocardia kujensis]
MRRRRFTVLLGVLVVLGLVAAPGPAAGFGTIDSGGQSREHERLTRAALSCAGDVRAEPDCFQPATMDYLAGHGHEFGAIGAPDSDELSDPAAHCDDADYVAGAYPRTRMQATASLVDCLNRMRMRFGEGLDAAQRLLGPDGEVLAGEVGLDPECRPRDEREVRAKCTTLEGFGRALHGVQDFYAHSNWADQADPARPVGDENPPGLDLPAPSPLLDLRGAAAPDPPADLSTGCYVARDEVPGVGACQLRVTHAGLNKDRGQIDPVTGAATDPTTPRGMVGTNFAKAVSGAVTETRREWQDFRSELVARYGTDRGERMICALTRDDPVNDCGAANTVVAVVALVGLLVVALGAIVWLRRSIRRSERGRAGSAGGAGPDR